MKLFFFFASVVCSCVIICMTFLSLNESQWLQTVNSLSLLKSLATRPEPCTIHVTSTSNNTFTLRIIDKTKETTLSMDTLSIIPDIDQPECSLFHVYAFPQVPPPIQVQSPRSDEIAILSVASGFSYVNKYIEGFVNRLHYAQLMGYPCVLYMESARILKGRTPHYFKIPALNQTLEAYPYVFFIDMDIYFDEVAFIHRIPLQSYMTNDFVEGDTDIILGNWVAYYFNTGLMFWRRSSFNSRFLTKWWDAAGPHLFHKHSFDQAAFWHVLFTEWAVLSNTEYNDELIADCSRGHNSCVKKYVEFMKKFGLDLPSVSTQYPFLFTFSQVPSHVERDRGSNLVDSTRLTRDGDPNLRVLHCMLGACKHEQYAFIHHTGHSNWKKIRKMIPFTNGNNLFN